jgi:hypothetical protein
MNEPTGERISFRAIQTFKFWFNRGFLVFVEPGELVFVRFGGTLTCSRDLGPCAP